MDFSTLNESSLHNTLKKLYAFQNDGKMEVELDDHVYDILTSDKTVIEIQTANLAKLLPKLLDALDKGHKVKLVHPIVIERRILLNDEQGNKISYRKSPKRGCIYDLFKELTGLYPILLKPDFELEVVEVNITEIRTRTSEPVQTNNKRRRFKKNWIKTGKKLDEIRNTITFNSAKDYLKLIPIDSKVSFCAKDLAEALKKDNTLPSSAPRNAHLIIWVLNKMELIEQTEIKNRSRYFKIKNE